MNGSTVALIVQSIVFWAGGNDDVKWRPSCLRCISEIICDKTLRLSIVLCQFAFPWNNGAPLLVELLGGCAFPSGQLSCLSRIGMSRTSAGLKSFTRNKDDFKVTCFRDNVNVITTAWHTQRGSRFVWWHNSKWNPFHLWSVNTMLRDLPSVDWELPAVAFYSRAFVWRVRFW